MAREVSAVITDSAAPGAPVMAAPMTAAPRESLAFLRSVLGDYHPRDFAVRLWDGTCWGPEPGQPARFTLVLSHPGALRAMFLGAGDRGLPHWPPRPSELTFGEAYIYGDVDIEGDIHAVFPLVDHLLARPLGAAARLGLAAQLFRLPAPPGPPAPPGRRQRPGRAAARLRGTTHSVARDRTAVTYHYDTSNAFYALYLDSQLVYSCAYFATADENLEVAQRRKLDYVCRKLRLRPGLRLLDIGCGWGALVRHAAREYGVRAHGITLSRPQADLANERIREEGLADRCSVDAVDYRTLHESEAYDAVASVGMAEHVGASRLGAYFDQVWRVLRPGGVFLNHAIAWNPMHRRQPGPSFIGRYVFPDGELLPINSMLRAAETHGFEIRDVERLREHYALTLRHWVRRLESHRVAAVAATDETTYRVWRAYMAGSAHGFETGRLNVYQTLLVKPDRGASHLPLTRADWYAARG